MNVVIIEDEEKLANQLKKHLASIDSSINVVSVIGSVETAISVLPALDSIDLMFVDIYLSDGLSFEIFQSIEINTPVIFCTAYDKYALKAFELDSLDYLLKPVKKSSLEVAIEKYKRIFSSKDDFTLLKEKITRLVNKLDQNKKYQKNFLLNAGDRLVPISTAEIHFFQTINGSVSAVSASNKNFQVDESLDSLVEQLDPSEFFRANRQFIINRKAIVDIEYYFNGRLSLNVHPRASEAIIISKAKATEFKHWMNQT